MSWAYSEAGLLLICACLPSLWPLIQTSFRLKSNPSKNLGTAYWEPKQSKGRSKGKGPQVWSEHGIGMALFGSQNHFIPLEDRGVVTYDHYIKLSSQASSTYVNAGPDIGETGISVRHDITQESRVTKFNWPVATYDGRC